MPVEAPIRPEVVDLLLDVDYLERSQSGRLVHMDGRQLSAAETELHASATPSELLAYVDLGLAVPAAAFRKYVLPDLAGPVRAEAVAILQRIDPFGNP